MRAGSRIGTMTFKKSDLGSPGKTDRGVGDGGIVGEKGAAELRGMMGDVMRQIADTERRNANVLKSMQERLDTLNQGARSVRSHVPAGQSPAFDSSEAAQSLADRAPANSAASGTDGAYRGFSNIPSFSGEAPSEDPFALDSMLGGDDFPADVPAPKTTARASAAAMPSAAKSFKATTPAASSTPEPQPLRSAAGHHKPIANGYRGNVDPFDIVESLPGNPADPWASDSAAALTDLYSSGETVFGGTRPAAGPAEPALRSAATLRRPVPAQSLDQPNLATAAVATVAGAFDRTGGIDRDWLEDRLADITSRLDRTLTEPHTDQSFVQLNSRLLALEARIEDAMSQQAHGFGAAPGEMGQIEAQLQILAADFEVARREFARLEVIEGQLDQLMHQVSDDRIGAIVGQAIVSQGAQSASGISENDLHSVAIAAAEAAVARMAESGLAGGVSDYGTEGANGTARRVEDLQTLLTTYVEERRQGDEQSVQIMDALQQAMLHVIDRLDRLDGGVADPEQQAGYHDDGQYEADQDYRQQYEHDEPEPYEQPATSNRSRQVNEQRQPRQHEEEAYSAESQPDLESDQDVHVARRDHRMPTLEQTPEAAAQSPISRQRASLQASVQRAAMAQRDKQREEKPALRKSGSSGRLMVSAVAIFAVIGFAAYMLTMSSDGTPASETATITPTAPASATASPGSPPAKSSSAQASLPSPAGTPPQVATQPVPVERPKAAASVQKSKAPRVIMPETVSEVDGEGVLASGSERMMVPLEPSAHFANLAGAAENLHAAAQFGTPGGLTEGAGQPSGFPALAIETAALRDKPASALELPPATVGPLSLRIAAAKGDPSAEFEVASRLAEGKGTDQDFKEAHRWYQRSAAQNFTQAQYRLGTLYERGLGAKADTGRAKAMYQRAAEQGNVKSMHNLAVLAAGRGGGTPDYSTAATWFTQAANHGLADSQFNLAVLTESGLGVEKDQVQAAMWFILAAQGGDKEALRRRDQIKSRMDKAEWSAAERLAANWQPMPPEKLANDARFAGELWKSRQTATAAPATLPQQFLPQ